LLSNPEINTLKTVLITGVTRFIRRYIAREFSQAVWSVFGLGTFSPENALTQDLLDYYQLTLPSNDLAILIQQLDPQV
jgi:UDP-glucose 4-epimerase